MKQFTSKNQKTGEYGELICKKYILEQGYKILDANFSTKEGEIDLIAKKKDIIYFIEVKSVSCENTDNIDRRNTYNPADNFNNKKLDKIRKVSYSWLRNMNIENKTQIDLYLVYIDRRKINHKIEILDNIF
jgi:putative endonuclease